MVNIANGSIRNTVIEMKVLLFGKNGQLGRELVELLQQRVDLLAVNRQECDYFNPEQIRSTIRQHKPNVIINAAAYTAVDRAESDYEGADIVNCIAPTVIGEEAARTGARVVHYSTDYVFDGKKIGSYTEIDEPAPLSVYGLTKLNGENGLIKSGANSIILRTSWVASCQNDNFIGKILKLSCEKTKLNVVVDQIGAPTTVNLISNVTAKILEIMKMSEKVEYPSGVYHLTASGYTNWYLYSKYIVERATLAGWPVTAKIDHVFPISSSDYNAPAKRPLNSILSTQKLTTDFGIELPDWKIGVTKILDDKLIYTS